MYAKTVFEARNRSRQDKITNHLRLTVKSISDVDYVSHVFCWSENIMNLEKYGYRLVTEVTTFQFDEISLGEYQKVKEPRYSRQQLVTSSNFIIIECIGWHGYTVLLKVDSIDNADINFERLSLALQHYDDSIHGLYAIGAFDDSGKHVLKNYKTGADVAIEHFGDPKYYNDISNAHKWLIDLRQKLWQGQSYTHIDDTLQKILFAKFYAERNQLAFHPLNYKKVYEQARNEYNQSNQVDIGPLRTDYIRIVEELMQYRVSSSPQIWHIINHLWTTKSLRREEGQYFTPYGMKRFMLEIYPAAKGEKVCDPCGGSGGFLVQAADSIDDFDANDFYYFELDKDRIFKVAQHTFNTYIHPKTGRNLVGINMVCRNSLSGDWETKMDRIYTNVPFGLRIKDWEAGDSGNLLNRYETGKNKKSELSQLLFIEQSLKHLKPGGTFATVVDKGIVTNIKYQEERAAIAEMAALELIVELPSVAFEHFSGTTFPTFLLFFRKTKPKFTRYEKIKNVGYDGSSYNIRPEGTGPFDFSLDEPNYKASDFTEVVTRWNARDWDNQADADHDYTYDTTMTGTWLWGHWKSLGVKGKRLKDRCNLIIEKWDGQNRCNPTVDRQYRYVKETHLNPKDESKTRMLREGCLLISRLLSNDQIPACGLIHRRYHGAGCTNENYIINPNSENDLITLWYRINFDQSCHEFLWDHCRGQGRGRIQEADFLNMPVADLSDDERSKASDLLEILKKKVKLDDLIERRLASL